MRLRYQIGGSIGSFGPWSNTYEFILGSAVSSQAVLQAITNSVGTTLAGSGAYKAALCTDTSLGYGKALYYPVNTGAATLVAQTPFTATAGTATAVHAPQVCTVASFRTGTAGRSYRGRAYIPYRSTNINALGVVASAGQTIINAHVSALVAAMGTALAAQSISGSWVVWSPKLGTGTAVNALLVGNQCDTQRHRNDNREEIYSSFAVTPLTVEVDPADPDADEKLKILNGVANAPIFGGRGQETLQGIIGLAALAE